MTTFVLGAGASRHAGYPLAKSMGSGLFAWMAQRGSSGCLDFRLAAQSLQAKFGNVDNIEEVLTKVDEIVSGAKEGCWQLANRDKPALVQAMREWFSELREQPAEAYRLFARRVVHPGDCVISFNYDVSLDRQLKLADLWEIGDGYGFAIEGLPAGSRVKLLNLHGSANWLDEISLQTRPLIGDSELRFLGYASEVDPKFPRNGIGAIQPLILPAACKRFYVETTFGRRREHFWDALWIDAALQLSKSKGVVLCGYSLPSIDNRACRLLLEGEYSASLEVCCGDDTERIIRQLRDGGHDAHAARQRLFQDWIQAESGEL